MLSINYEFRKGILFIRLIGELTKQTSLQLKTNITDMIEDNGITNVVFNISKLISIDEDGINNLLKSFEMCKKNAGKALLCGGDKEINAIFKNNVIDDEFSAFNKIII